jgi:hypothetical protein
MQELLGFVDAQYAAFRATAEGVPPHLRERAPGDGRWSVAEIIDHVGRVERAVAQRVTTALAEAREQGTLAEETETSSVVIPLDFDRVRDRTEKRVAPERAHPRPGVAYAEAWAALEEAHAAARAALAAGDGFALGSHSVPHPVLGPLTLYQWGVALGGHEARHAEQIRETVQAVAATLEAASVTVS